MRQFLKFFLASLLGTVVGLLVTGFILAAIIAGTIAVSVNALDDEKEDEAKPNSILHLRLDMPVVERTPEIPFEFSTADLLFGGKPRRVLGLNDVLAAIKHAAKDDHIRGIYLDLNGLQAGPAAAVEIRNALLRFKKSGKFVIAYGDAIPQRAYYVGTAADSIFLNPTGYLEFTGMAVGMVYLRRTLDMLHIEPQVFKAGKYKSAVEMFTAEKMGDADRYQMNEWLQSRYRSFLEDVGAGRGIAVNVLDSIADSVLVRNAGDALQYRLVDRLYFDDQVQSVLRKKTGLGHDDELNLVALERYRYDEEGEGYKPDRIALLYASGEIGRGESMEGRIGSEGFVKALREAVQNKKVKAIVIRINSPGGDALASDIAWREVALARRKKPVIVSMGDMAASGGYYIACAADTIVAQPSTLTGSIGVFAVLPNMQKFYNDKIGFTFDRITTGASSDFPTETRPLTEREKMILRQEVDRMYRTFVERVAEGRHASFEKIDSVAQGRVWSGRQAKEAGLVDVEGGIGDALAIAAYKAGIKEYTVEAYPRQNRFLKQLFEEVMKDLRTGLAPLPGEEYKQFARLKAFMELRGVQARLPFEIDLSSN